MLYRRQLILSFSIFCLSACTSVPAIFPGVHQVPVQQGNIVTQEMVDELRPGMTKNQVRFVLGGPLAVDPFNQDRWDYFYSMTDSDGNQEREKLTVFFEENSLVRIEGDYAPSAGVESGEF